jgi:uncharacterized C2H2 Zn-finger protein
MNELKVRMQQNAGVLKEETIMKHLQEMDQESYMICDACGKTFKDKDKYHKHMSSCSARN